MWPIMLDMTTEECRGILRRLELEAYSNLMSSFRAQGCLSDNKIKLLEELRTILHISIDRHRAEARRVANDEQLCTIAEALFGSNTGREWSIEGKRPFPLLPRGAAFTALNIVAEKGSEVGCDKNTKLPEPFETRREHVTPSEVDQNKKVVVQDPLRFHIEKINLKRSLSLPAEIQQTSPAIKRRGDILMLKHQAHTQQQFQQNIQMLSQQLQQTNQPILSPQTTNNQVHTNSRIQQLYHTHSKTQSRQKRGMATKRGKGRTPIIRSGSAGAAVSVSDNKTEKRMREKVIYPVIKNEHSEHSGASNIMNIEIPLATPPLQSPTSGTIVEAQQIFVPQIATSKKDIASNLTKLNLNVNNNGQNTVPSPSIVTTGVSTPQSQASQIHQPQKTMKIISSSSLNIKLTNNILQKSLTGKIINPNQFDASAIPSGQSAIPIGSKINLQIQSANNKPVTSTNQIPLTLSPTHVQPVLTSPSQSASQLIASSAPGSNSSSEHINLKISPQPEAISNLNVNKPPAKVQIISQQIIQSPNMLKSIPGSANPLTTPIKIPSQQGNPVQLKTISTAGKNQIKLIPAGGKVLIKSSQANHKMTGITQLKGTTGTSTPNNNNLTTNFQKLQLMPVKTDSSGKSNIILMQKINQTQAQGGTLKSVKLTKDMNKIIANATKNVTITPSKLNNTQTQNFNQNNVIVLGFQDAQQPQQQHIVQQNNQINQHHTDNNKMIGKINSGVITEDTPVDIIPSINPNVTDEIIINGNLDGAQSTTKTSNALDDSELIEPHQITDWEDELDHHTSNILKNLPKKSLSNVEGEEDQNKILLYELSHNTDDDEDDFIEEDHTLEEDDDVELHEDEDELEDDGVTEDDDDDDIIMDEINSSPMKNNIYGKAMESAHINFETYSMSGGRSMSGGAAKLLTSSGTKAIMVSSGNTGGGNTSGVKRKIIKNNNNKIVAVDDVEALMIEMHEMDDSSNRKLRNMTIGELIASGQIVTTDSMVSPEIAEMANGDNVSE